MQRGELEHGLKINISKNKGGETVLESTGMVSQDGTLVKLIHKTELEKGRMFN